MDITEAKATDLVDSIGAARILGCSHDQIRQWAKTGYLPSYGFNPEGELVERVPGKWTRRNDLIFLRDDVEKLTRRSVGRPPKPAKAAR